MCKVPLPHWFAVIELYTLLESALVVVLLKVNMYIGKHLHIIIDGTDNVTTFLIVNRGRVVSVKFTFETCSLVVFLNQNCNDAIWFFFWKFFIFFKYHILLTRQCEALFWIFLKISCVLFVQFFRIFLLLFVWPLVILSYLSIGVGWLVSSFL